MADLYVKAVMLKDISASQAPAVCLARAQFSYAQSRLEREGVLPAEMPYQGPADDLLQNGYEYQLNSICNRQDDGWQLQVEVIWNVRNNEKKMVFMRLLQRHKDLEAEGDDHL